jgi:hypothetical protein
MVNCSKRGGPPPPSLRAVQLENQHLCGNFVYRLCSDVPNQTMKCHVIPCLIEGEIDPGIGHAVEGHQPEQVLHLVLCSMTIRYSELCTIKHMCSNKTPKRTYFTFMLKTGNVIVSIFLNVTFLQDS